MAPNPTPELYRLEIHGDGPEDVAVLEDRLVTGVADGRLLSVAKDGSNIKVVADTGGRPLGIEALPDGRLIVCDAHRGLLRVDPAGDSVEPLVTTVDGEPMKLCNNAAVAGDGTIYFTDSSRRYGLDAFQTDVIERTATGRLLRRDPAGEVQVLLDHLEFANGVALADDESFVAVAETSTARIHRVWLHGPRCGESEVLVDQLPGLPDNLSTGTLGRIWVALPVTGIRPLRFAQRTPRSARRLIGRAASAVNHAPAATARVLAINRDGTAVARLACSRRCGYRMVTGVREHDGSLYLGSIAQQAIAAVSPAPSNPTEQVIKLHPHR
ncbi:MAG TPA: SMP-30/gluconolactonase/LRE family protein [Mycobacterium sp.]|uniref:SMP-30/gluconolactonase/LRE family protein n=1 Tax=Mycobacterium sp. TaxID=1785 RepID=UPI002D4D0366|nr:SMP-30/gluconolactonase/LRE family protein [Mycobacterium sp.]HZU49720.1 SMP-30/gluconolactonase/LRE family protein [Mycobacterium sp.]